MKKIVALVLALALILACTAALADTTNREVDWNLAEQKKPYNKYMGEWEPNFDGTHTQKGKTVACEYEYVTVGNTTIKACPVCGDFNGEKVERCVSRYLKINRIDNTQKKELTNKVLTSNGQYIVRILQLPEDADIKYAVTICHEIAGLAYNADAMYDFTLPINGEGLTVEKALFGSTVPVTFTTGWAKPNPEYVASPNNKKHAKVLSGKTEQGEVSATKLGLYIKPATPSLTFGLYVIY